jgi:4-hydroxy-3-methylbut-2-enyl diphosphate reductase
MTLEVPGKVLLAAPRGYCAGVDRAVDTVERTLALHGPPIYVRKQIVHNLHVVQQLEAKGAVFVEELDEVPEGSIVVFSAHGVAPVVHEQAAQRRLRSIDATCPLVTKVHNEARRYARDDYEILLIGHEGHEEVVGTSGEAPAHVQLVDGPAGAAQVQVRDPERVVWLSQTTLSVDETLQTVQALQDRFPALESPPSDDICYATQNRQAAVKEIAPRVELFLVVGSQNSSNSIRMVEVARDAGAAAAYLVENAGAVHESWLAGVRTVGLSSGASVPEVLVSEVLGWLAERGYGDVETVSGAPERLVFALPPELRRELRAAQTAASGGSVGTGGPAGGSGGSGG